MSVGEARARIDDTDPQQLLTNYLALVYSLRGLPVGTPIPLRFGDVAVLADALRIDQREVSSTLGKMIVGTDEVREHARGLRRRLVVPVAGILVGLTAAGGLLLVRSDRAGSHGADAKPQGPDRLGDGHRRATGAGGQCGSARTCVDDRQRRRATSARSLTTERRRGLRRRGKTAGMRDWSVVSGIIERDGALLLVANQRRNGSIDWSPPGGVIEEGEHEIDALTREVEEETGLTVDAWIGPVYEVVVDLGLHGGRLRVVVYRAIGHRGDFVFDDPDGIVFDAGFYDVSACHAYISDAPQWVAEPLRDWLAAPWSDVRNYEYRCRSVVPRLPRLR